MPDWITVALDTGSKVVSAGGLLVVLIGGYKGWWVYGPIHNKLIEMWRERWALEKERGDDWQRIALSGVVTADKLASVASKKA